MPIGVAAFIFIAAVTVSLIIVTNKKMSKKIRIAAGILGGLAALFTAGYILLAFLLFAAID
ncbi:MAG: hypothetical protein LBL98_00070 [Ruminococcus sp.]|jgi:hypothetical protein|nr:hypothetical protein [Ruminococcus sp.]